MYWEEEKTLVVSDLHIGKTGHFRKHGIAVPQDVYKHDLQRLFASLQHFQPQKLVIVGDLFHSHANKELDWFLRWRNDFASTRFVLVKGNHDILPEKWYSENSIETCPQLRQQHILLQHQLDLPLVEPTDGEGMISGHVHPAISIKTGPRQSLRLPCFYFSGSQCILPAFGQFTGTYSVRPTKNDQVFAISNKEILQLTY